MSDSRPRLFILVGIPGCGKSTWSKTFLSSARVISSDEIREELYGDATVQSKNSQVFNVFHQRIGEGLAQGKDVVADSTALDEYARENLRDIAKTFNAEVHLVWFANLHQAINRNRKRDRVVPPDAMARMMEKYERFRSEMYLTEYRLYDSTTEIRSVDSGVVTAT